MVIQGKSPKFLNARRKIPLVINKGEKHKGKLKVNNITFRVSNLSNKKHSVEADIEIFDSVKTGKGKLTIYRDNKKKEGKKEQTIMIS